MKHNYIGFDITSKLDITCIKIWNDKLGKCCCPGTHTCKNPFSNCQRNVAYSRLIFQVFDSSSETCSRTSLGHPHQQTPLMLLNLIWVWISILGFVFHMLNCWWLIKDWMLNIPTGMIKTLKVFWSCNDIE